ncbi:MAG: Dihydrofolate synthase @ Folylpolyglutamate synthase [uncultured Solirubrobacterales bacterium]|uniref:tetrahydrofolate synthase n=1 Tax=uncultured Solirubrobacterales bacterium TaxID=768556 RepID=A0A6J4T7F1_9ACTN|nr:MAG: Dihydrofolate synthase @ Folylpolyglutamate synthase [uncultured Solirubrobacterales bacterium]
MNYAQAESHLLDLELFGMRFGLDRMRKLTTVLGMPQRRFASVHVVGTNGKSSTARMIAAILEAHGLRTGTYTSPHLTGFRERIEVAQAPIAEADFAAALTRAARAAELVDRTLESDDRVTQFELLTAAAYHALARARVEVAVIEAGLGGRHDATNVIPSKVQVLTGVALEHTRWLGPTLSHVAEEKLAVVPDHGCLVAGELGPEADAVAERVAAERGARRIRVTPEAEAEVPPLPRAPGAYQRRNFTLATAAARAFLAGDLDREAVAAAAQRVSVPGRLEPVAERPLVLLDGAHNPAGARALAESTVEVVGSRTLVGVVGVLDDKDPAGILAPLLPLMRRVVLTQPALERALPAAVLRSLCGQLAPRLEAEVVRAPAAALERARALAGADGAVLVTGSLHLVADLVRAPESRASAL